MFLVSVLIFSCKEVENKVTIVNDLKNQIDSVLVFGNRKCNPLVFRSIVPDKPVIGYLKNCTIKDGDGSYGVEVYYNNKVIKKGFGYYTNGWMHFEKLEIIITEDANIVVNQK